ncbi:hypothetical protein JVX96_20940 [Variovorax sp. PDNC026]|uniref:hypothetical protein n=1 Tax=Variovorax sp. PDNC026 TaxID=2811425 RepID=UPI0019668F9C|nr:hypothetical protein [Variovorax sp. PDNC026]QRY30538.1 hypothetical protein JVX96_20940 [Variovorax sp. PDNC026]
MFTIYSVAVDTVINATVGTGKTSYAVALEHLYPLINQLAIQRKLQDPKFYDRLKRDIVNGCIMPPITIAYIAPDIKDLNAFDKKNLKDFMEENIGKAFILDGIQRLNTLHRASDDPDFGVHDNPLYVNVIVCRTMDSLLYRMITLNNGQRGMTTRHQVEIVTSNLYDFSDSVLTIQAEKAPKRRRGAFKKADFVLAYLAFLSNSTTIDSQKLIEEKLDELIAFKILESDPIATSTEFSDVLDLIEEFCKIPASKEWFRNVNNLVGFASAIKASYSDAVQVSPERFSEVREEFEKAFSSFSVSKIKLGQARRSAANWFIKNFSKFEPMSYLEMMEELAAHV